MRKPVLFAVLVLLAGCATEKFSAKNDFFLDQNFRQEYLKQKPELPEAVKQAIAKAEIIPGMPATVVSELLGLPPKRYISETEMMEVWFYPRLSIGFNNKGQVISVVEEPSLRRLPDTLDREIRERRLRNSQQKQAESKMLLAKRIWQLAFLIDTPEQPGQVWVVTSQGKGLKQVGSLVEYLTWAFDEKTLVGVVLKKKEDGTAEESFAIFNLETGESKVVAVESNGGYPSWVPQQKLLAVHTGQGRRVIFVDKQGNQKTSEVLAGKLNQSVFLPSWSPDGATVAFYEMEGRMGNLVVLETTSQKQIIVLEGVEARPIVWSPDSRRFLATRFLSQGSSGRKLSQLPEKKWGQLKRELVVIDVYTGKVMPTGIRGKAGQFSYSMNAWSPEGNSFVVCAAGSGKKENIYLVEVSGRLTKITDLPRNVSCQEACFQPDGSRIAFVLNSEAIWTVTVEGKEKTLLAETREGIIKQLVWCPWGSLPESQPSPALK